MTADKSPSPDDRLQQEFNRWADAGEGEKMERHHLDITEKTMRLMDLRSGERVLDMGCGSGWATRLLARMVSEGPQGFGQVVGVDISDEMVRQARAASKDFENVMFVVGSAAQIPWEENFFDKVLSVESFYYYPDQERALAELFRAQTESAGPCALGGGVCRVAEGACFRKCGVSADSGRHTYTGKLSDDLVPLARRLEGVQASWSAAADGFEA